MKEKISEYFPCLRNIENKKAFHGSSLIIRKKKERRSLRQINRKKLTSVNRTSRVYQIQGNGK